MFKLTNSGQVAADEAARVTAELYQRTGNTVSAARTGACENGVSSFGAVRGFAPVSISNLGRMLPPA
ncbi:hypothetical protein ART_3251 [Arthrobacter sp. PAMC 25486]|nr:hypothetical protein ART_3251 [Arthrobacter sp. PAMC 25486]